MGAAPCTCKQREPIATQHFPRGLSHTCLASRLQHNIFYAACLTLAWQADCNTTCSTRRVSRYSLWQADCNTTRSTRLVSRYSLWQADCNTACSTRLVSRYSLWQADCNTTCSMRLLSRLPGKPISNSCLASFLQ
jgi:hypothetical protein